MKKLKKIFRFAADFASGMAMAYLKKDLILVGTITGIVALFAPLTIPLVGLSLALVLAPATILWGIVLGLKILTFKNNALSSFVSTKNSSKTLANIGFALGIFSMTKSGAFVSRIIGHSPAVTTLAFASIFAGAAWSDKKNRKTIVNFAAKVMGANFANKYNLKQYI